MKPLASIQILRALAALAVVLFHALQWSHLDFAVGAAGVDVFFVISGFVLWRSTQMRPTAPGVFLLARVGRVLPMYWIVTLATGVAAVLRPAALPIIHPEIGHLALSLLLVPHYGPGGDPFPLLPTGWTLTYEAFFYAAMAIALMAPRDRRPQVLSGLVLTAALLGFGYHDWYTLLCNPLLLEFLAGVGLARLWGEGRIGRWPRVWGWSLLSGGLLILAVCQASGLRDDFLRPFVWGPPAAMIVAGALKLEADGRIGSGLLVRVLGAQGDAAYSLYLVQAPVIAVFAWLTPDWPPGARATSAVLLALLAGWLAFSLLERPIGSALRRLQHLPVAHRRRGRGFGPAEQETLATVDADLT